MEVGVKIEKRTVWEVMEISLQKEVIVAFILKCNKVVVLLVIMEVD